jgi:ATP-dependent protease ClpP protease subunit
MKAWTARDIRNLKTKGNRSWYEIKNQTDGPTQVMLYDEIGGWGVYARDFLMERSAIEGPVDLHISSEGGEVFEGVAIYQAIKQRGGVTVYVDSLAASIASVIAMGADRVVMGKNATMMIHDAAGLAMGDAKTLRDLADLLDKTSDNIASIYAEKAGGTPENWRTTMRGERWYSAQEAVDAGLADAILGAETTASAKASAGPQAAVQPIVNEIPELAAPEVDDNVVTPTADDEPLTLFDPDEFRRAMAAATADALEGVPQ